MGGADTANRSHAMFLRTHAMFHMDAKFRCMPDSGSQTASHAASLPRWTGPFAQSNEETGVGPDAGNPLRFFNARVFFTPPVTRYCVYKGGWKGWQAVEPLWGGRRGKGVWMGMQGKGRAGQSGGGSLCKECGMWGVGCCVGGGESCWARSGRAAVRGGRGVWDVACGAWDKRSRRCGRGAADVFRGRNMARWNAQCGKLNFAQSARPQQGFCHLHVHTRWPRAFRARRQT